MGGIWSAFVGLLEQTLLWFSTTTGSVGFGIIIFTICARLIILPLTLTSLRSSRKMQQIQPLIKELQRKHGKDQQKLQEETLKLYREYKINPVGGCLPVLLQLPIFFGVYQAVYHLMVEAQRVNLSAGAKAALENPSVAALFDSNHLFLGLFDLGKTAFGPGGLGFAAPIYLVLPVLSILLQLMQTTMATPRTQDPQQKAMTQAMMFMPLVFGYIAFTFPTGAVLYWVVSSLVGVVQQYFTSGWGSLANYLKFLPPDSGPAAPSPLTPAVVVSSGSGEPGSTLSVAAQRADFWSVMRPLTETETQPEADATEEAIDDARLQGRAPENPRRPRRRR
ncbi:YidC/Oxa1 family membrane protein insertase [Oscillochloris sp. ZM17-4]|uniref:YidC/Oxa1 family membrane protein insertase n=1 Tax=Oscillochloris sp. ZM17-4 TaxID=2866714 RepID=UPI001C7351D9|nr:YidC/Oxa1 family membrane protein insertase [Oscillochloris sp. ZM17-4]MBX0328088.1 YidC/Oxa1 family membrane protein insertase [Oscillochloris sp. ZM17-4]